jgi:hypothetical protein
MSVGAEHVGYKDAGDLPPGEAQVHQVQWAPGQSGPATVFGCPRGRGVCLVPCKPSPASSRGCSWDLSGDPLAPTLSPSVNCDKGCGWHGWVKNGKAE